MLVCGCVCREDLWSRRLCTAALQPVGGRRLCAHHRNRVPRVRDGAVAAVLGGPSGGALHRHVQRQSCKGQLNLECPHAFC